MTAPAYAEDIRREPPRTDVSKPAASTIYGFVAIAMLTTGGILTVAWIGLLGWLLVHAVSVTLG